MAAKKRKQADANGVPPWLGVAVALLIAGLAGFALLTIERDAGPASLPKLVDEPESHTHHDREQIDEASREQLRDILRAADEGETP